MNKRARIFWIAAACAIAWMLFMRPYTPINIVQFELAHTVDNAIKIIADWGEEGVGCRVAASFSDIQLFKSPAIFFMRAVWFAGACDLIENFAMLFTLSHVNEFSVSMSFYFAIIKFMIVVITLIFILLAAAVGLFNMLYKK